MTHPSVRALLAEAPLLAASVHALPAAAEGRATAPTAALVFGREESGPGDSELSLCTHACAIPTGRALPSLNLSHAVAAVLSCLFELALGQRGGVDVLDPGAQLFSGFSCLFFFFTQRRGTEQAALDFERTEHVLFARAQSG